MSFLNPERVSTEDELGRIFKDKILNEFCDGYSLVGEDRTCMPDLYLRIAEQIKNFEVKDDDVWVATFPKAGTTWTQEMVWMIANDLDFKGGEVPLHIRYPFLEMSGYLDEEKVYETVKLEAQGYNFNSVKTAADQKRPRFIKTHLAFSLLPEQLKNKTRTPKIIYVVRNPKDACISFCHHGNLTLGWRLDVDSCAKLFMADRLSCCPFWKHVFGYWELRDQPNFLFLKYEDMKADLPAVIRKVAKFLEKELTDGQVDVLTKHLSFESMKSNPAVNMEDYVEHFRKSNLVYEDGSFIRAGKVGKYKEELSPETIKEFDAWIRKNVVGTSFEKEYDFNL